MAFGYDPHNSRNPLVSLLARGDANRAVLHQYDVVPILPCLRSREASCSYAAVYTVLATWLPLSEWRQELFRARELFGVPLSNMLHDAVAMGLKHTM